MRVAQKWRELTYRTEYLDARLVRDMAERFAGLRIVVRMPKTGRWKRAWLISVSKTGDRFRIRWTRKGKAVTLVGIWRVHNPGLFTEDRLLPVPRGPARMPDIQSNPRRATRTTWTKESNPNKGKFGPLHPAWKDELPRDPSNRRKHIRKLLRGEIPVKCEVKGCRRKPEVHHKDGNNENNSIGNIQFLCKNHHAQMHGRQRASERERDQEGRYMATRATRSKKGATTKKAASAAGSNGGGRKDKLAHMTEAQRRKAANTIYKMRGQGKSWSDIMEVVDIPGSMTGRRLLRDYGPDDAETVIRERKIGNASNSKSSKAKAKSRKRAAEPDEDEEDEEPEEAPRPKRRVRVKRGSGSKSNPS